MSDADRQKDPVYNPAWPYFETCMQSSSAPLRASSQARFTQQDLTAFLVALNRANPDPKINLMILTPTQRKAAVQPGSGAAQAVAFLECADQWLTKSSMEVFEATGIPNEYYPRN